MDDAALAGILPLAVTAFATLATVGGLVFSVYFINELLSRHKKRSSHLPPVPEVPGWPVIGNLLEMKEKKPHKTFMRWAETYGPIYFIKTGASTIVVLNSSEVAKEAMVTRHSSLSTRKMSKALTVLTQDKTMVATSDYNEFHKTVKRHVLTNMLGATAQRRHRVHRDVMMDNVSSQFRDHVVHRPGEAVDFRKIFESELFGIGLKEALGTDVDSVYVPELGATVSREEIFNVFVRDPMEGSIDVDWRDFFPYLAWIPNRSFELKIEHMHSRREAVMSALINQQKKRIASRQELNCYVDYLLSEGTTLTDKQIRMLIWETIIQTVDTTMVTTEWAMYELARSPHLQDRLYQEIRNVCGSEIVSEEHLPQLAYLNAIFHETIRKYTPAPVIPLRYAHEDTQLAGFYIPKGSQVAINLYGCNMDKNQWEDPEEWRPERFLNGQYDPIDLHKTMAFGAGKRACAGVLQAMLISSRAIGRLVQAFEWRLKDGEIGNVDTVGLATRKLYPLHVVIQPRDE